MNQKQQNAQFRYEIKFYLVWNSKEFKESHNILFGEVLWWKNIQTFYTYLKSVSVSLQVYFSKNIIHF